MGVGMRSIRAEASHQSVVPRSTVLRFCLEQRAARYRLDLTRSFGECAFISFARYVVNYKNASEKVSYGRKPNPFQRL